ncbi:SPOSA6832_02098 [Sporobolomyces salmonicolor]|uniref:Chitin synthase n=1 Tax=Sporidiobolus salmonicolor TaxID=5005 RepID=A0A0D6EL41_SPOSA|nr:SPOSA6832_02098 [Sporobolomyces salmonicolor]
MRRRPSQDYGPQGFPDPNYAQQQPQYISPTTAHQYAPQPQSLHPQQHSPVMQRPPPPQQSPSYHSNPLYSDQGHDDLYGFYAADDHASIHSHTALTMEKDYYAAASSLPPPHALSPQFPGAPSYPPHSPSIRPPAPASPASYFVGGWAPGGYYEQQGYYAQARQDVMKRREKKRVELQDGHLVLDLPVARSLTQLSSFKGEDLREESGKLRYTAVTDEPDDFTRKRYRLRQSLYGRQTELFICCTIPFSSHRGLTPIWGFFFFERYNEDDALFVRTFTSVIKNIQHLQSRTKSKTWGNNAWKKVVVCVVSDGRSKIHPRTLKLLGLYGAYQDGVMKDEVEGKDVQAHVRSLFAPSTRLSIPMTFNSSKQVFEYTTNVVVDANGQVSGGISPIQVLFCLKEQNKKKLNSHRWAFNAFCPQLNPNVCVLIDVGTKPAADAIYKLWKAFDRSPHVGGACGEITVDTGRGCVNLFNPLVAAQNFEYKMSNILDKPLESVFGFISVLPGAFSAYRYKALLGRPLETYFLGEKARQLTGFCELNQMHQPGNLASLSDSNMYLAEDRILCFEIVAKKNERWVLRYVNLHATSHYYRLLTSGQSFFRKIWMSILVLYNAVQLVFSFLGLSSFYLAFFFLCNSATSDPSKDPFGGHGTDVISVANGLFIATIGITIVCALGNKPSGSSILPQQVYCTCWTIILTFQAVTDWSEPMELLKQSGFRDIVIALAATYGLYVISSILHFDPWHLMTSFIQYMLLVPAFIIVLTIYSLSNTHDISWCDFFPRRLSPPSCLVSTRSSSSPLLDRLYRGTKGQETVKDLGGAKKTKNSDGKEMLEVSVPTKAEDVDSLYVAMRKELSTPPVEQKQHRSAEQKHIDHYATIRTNTLLVSVPPRLGLPSTAY